MPLIPGKPGQPWRLSTIPESTKKAPFLHGSVLEGRGEGIISTETDTQRTLWGITQYIILLKNKEDLEFLVIQIKVWVCAASKSQN